MVERKDLSVGPAEACSFCHKAQKVLVRGHGKFRACPACLGSPGAKPLGATNRAAKR